MTQKTRVVQVLASLNRGGIETWLKDASRFYNKDQFQIDFILTGTEKGVYAPIVEAEGCNIFMIPLSKGLFSFSRSLYKTLKTENYNVIHAHPHFFCGWICFISLLAGVSKRISHSHNDTSDIDKKSSLTKKLYNKIQRFLILMCSTRKVACSEVAGKALFGEKSKFDIVYCGIDFSKFSKKDGSFKIREQLLEEMQIPLDSICIGHVGRFNEQKNHTFLIDIFREINKKKQNTYLFLVGSGPLQETIKKTVKEENIPNILFLGGRDDVDILMKEVFDIFLFPSLHEGLPLTLLEAQAANLKCLISDTISKETIFLKENISLLSLRDSSEVWSRALLDMLKEENKIKDEDIVAKLRTCQFSIEHSTQKLEQIYTTIK